MINDLKNIVYTILNKENRGELSPVEFNGLAYTTQLGLFSNHLTDYRASVIKMNRGNASYGLADVSKKQRQIIDIFGIDKRIEWNEAESTLYQEIIFDLPEDCAWLETVKYGLNTVYEVERTKWLNVVGNKKMKPSNEYPIYFRTGNKISVQPPIMNTVTLFYLRFPKRPKWTYKLINGNPVFNQSASDYQDIELHKSELPDMVYSICALMGINLKDGELFQYLEMLKDKKYQKENIV